MAKFMEYAENEITITKQQGLLNSHIQMTKKFIQIEAKSIALCIQA